MNDLSRIAFVVLAAGAGRRFGGEKLDAEFRGKAMGLWATNAVEKAGAIHRYIVTGPVAPKFTRKLDGWTIVTNADADLGIGTSIRAATEAVFNFDRMVISLADMPFVSAAHLRNLAAEPTPVFTRQNDGNVGVPAAFPKSHFSALMKLPDDRGASDLVEFTHAKSIDVASEQELFDIDTQPRLAALQSITN